MAPDDAQSGTPPPEAPRRATARRFAEYLLAILGGNVLFLFLQPHLPATLRHQTFRIDWGLGIDFAICLAVYGLLRLVWRK